MDLKTLISAVTLSALLIPTGALAQDGTGETATEEAGATEKANTRVVNGTKFGAWTVSCEALAVNETACVLNQTLVRSSDNQFLAEVLAFWSGDGERSFMAARVPNGVFFPSGFAFKPEDSEDRQEFVWQSCSRDLCEALLSIDTETFAALEAGADIYAGYRPRLGADPVVFRLNFDGIGEGMAALKGALTAK